MILGFLKGLADDRPSFWRGVGEGLAGRGTFCGGTFLLFQDHRTGLGMEWEPVLIRTELMTQGLP
jgi:hypothetical protein